jgi:hypothetical protein
MSYHGEVDQQDQGFFTNGMVEGRVVHEDQT